MVPHHKYYNNEEEVDSSRDHVRAPVNRQTDLFSLFASTHRSPPRRGRRIVLSLSLAEEWGKRRRESNRENRGIFLPDNLMAEREASPLPLEVRARLAELELELSEGKNEPRAPRFSVNVEESLQ